jgi:hypothetical protein
MIESPRRDPRHQQPSIQDIMQMLDKGQTLPPMPSTVPSAPMPTLNHDPELVNRVQQFLQQHNTPRLPPSQMDRQEPPPPPPAPPGGYRMWNPAQPHRVIERPGLLFRDRLT